MRTIPRILAGVAGGALAVTVAAGTATAAPAPYHPTTPNAATQAPPPGAVPAKGALPSPGRHGAAFSPKRVTSAARASTGAAGPADASDYPYVVAVHTRSSYVDSSGHTVWYDSYCTGSILSPTKVLTSADCAVGRSGGSAVVIAGTDDASSAENGFVSQVGSSWVEPGYQPPGIVQGQPMTSRKGDVAVLSLLQPLPSTYTPIGLTAQGDTAPYAPGTQVLTVGYGLADTGTSTRTELQKATVPLDPDATCHPGIPGFDPAQMSCAPFHGDTVFCGYGDGAPFTVDGRQAGIAFREVDGCGVLPDVAYEKVAAFHDDITADPARLSPGDLDFTGDGHTDILARTPDGHINDYPGTGWVDDGNQGFGQTSTIGTGWNGFTQLLQVSGWTWGQSVLAEDQQGNLRLYSGDGNGGFAPGNTIVGTGWDIFSKLIATNDFTGDGNADVLGITPNGDLYLYEWNGTGWVDASGTWIGTGWNVFDTVSALRWKANGPVGLVGRTANGALRYYAGNGQGAFSDPAGIQIGAGFGQYGQLLSAGDWSGDDVADLITVDGAGNMYLYTADGNGGWADNGQRRQIGEGWNGYTAF